MAIYEQQALRYINLLVVFYFNKIFGRSNDRSKPLKNMANPETPDFYFDALSNNEIDLFSKVPEDPRLVLSVPDDDSLFDREDEPIIFGTTLMSEDSPNDVRLFILPDLDANWSTFPKSWCLRPCYYQNIVFDIPIQFQKLIYFLYYLWMFHGVVNFMNLVGGILIEDTTVVIFSIFYTPFCLFYSFAGWYRCAYQTFKTNSAYYFMGFLYTFLIQFLMICVQSLGVPNSGTLGFITVLEAAPRMDDLRVVVGVVIAGACCCIAALDLVLIMMVAKQHPQIAAFFLKNACNKHGMKIPQVPCPF